MDRTEDTSALPAAETPPIEVEVLQIALAAAAAGDGAIDEEREAAPDAAHQIDALTATHAEQRRQDAERYRQALLRTEPEVPPELVTGATVDEVDTSLAAARATVQAVRRHLAHQAAGVRVPAGAPLRGEPDAGALSPRQKIALALVGTRSA